MSTKVLTDAYISIGGVDLSGWARKVTLNYSAELVDDTVFGDSSRSRAGGLKDWSVEVEFLQDHAAGGPDATLFPLVGSTAAIAIRSSKTDAKSSTNPEYTGTGIVGNITPVQGGVGEMELAMVTIPSAGTALTRDTGA